MTPLRRGAIALAFVALGVAGPVAAQDSAPTATPAQTASARFLALKDALVAGVETKDTVILLCVGLDNARTGKTQLGFGVHYLTAGGKTVRSAGGNLPMALIQRLFVTAGDVAAIDTSWRATSMVVAHGKPSLTLRHDGDADYQMNFAKWMDAESARVFPGIPLEPYKGPKGDMDMEGV